MLDKTLIPWPGLCRALGSCIETAIWTFNPLALIEVHYMEKNLGMFSSKALIPIFYFFFVINYFFFFHTQQHNIQNTTKQNNRHILNISRSNQKGGGEGRTTRTQKSLLYTITYVQQKTLPSINGRGLGPTNSRRCTFT